MSEVFGGEVDLGVDIERRPFARGLRSEGDVLRGSGVVTNPGGDASGVDVGVQWIDCVDDGVRFDPKMQASDGAR